MRISLSLYNSVKINVDYGSVIMQKRRLKLKNIRKKMFEHKHNLFLNNLTKIKYKKSPLADIVKGELKITCIMVNSPN